MVKKINKYRIVCVPKDATYLCAWVTYYADNFVEAIGMVATLYKTHYYTSIEIKKVR